jgi:hypothetical protein
MKKRVVALADLHSGHEYGLCPPFAFRDASTDAGKFEIALWSWYTQTLDSLKPIDIILGVGDMIDGKGEKSGGVEQITTDRLDQTEMAAQAIAYAQAPVIRLFYGTRYHVGRDEDFEKSLVDKLRPSDVTIQGHGFFNINNRAFDVKHKVSGSSVPHGRATPLWKAVMWNKMWASEGRQPKGEIFLRAHVHYHAEVSGFGWRAMSLPALTYKSHFGVRECEGLVDVGLVYFDVMEDGSYTWEAIPAPFAELKVEQEVL